MASPDTSNDPRMVAPDQLCATCGAPLAADQRYCLNCGRRLQRRDDLWQALAPPPPRPPVEPVTVLSPRAGRNASLLGAGVLGIALLLAGVAGALVAQDPDQAPPQVRVAAAPQPNVNVTVPVTSVGGGAGAVAEVTAADWSGDDGWTIALQRLPKDGTDQAALDAAVKAAEDDGAKDVGALDSDEFSSLDPGEFIVFSGVFKTKKAAAQAFAKLRKKFPDGEVVEVSASGDGGSAPKVEKDAKTLSDSEIEDLAGASGKDQQEKSKKLPDKIGTQGTPPKKDNKEPGGGSDSGTVLE